MVDKDPLQSNPLQKWIYTFLKKYLQGAVTFNTKPKKGWEVSSQESDAIYCLH